MVTSRRPARTRCPECSEPGGPCASEVLRLFPTDWSSEQRPFVWFPLAGERHAVFRKDRQVPVGEPMRCLCGAVHPRAATEVTDWMWPTCVRCWEEACKVAGLRRR